MIPYSLKFNKLRSRYISGSSAITTGYFSIFVKYEHTVPMSRAIFLLVGCLLALGACTRRMICPAYQSAFIHDQAAQYRRFSYFNEDSTPKIFTVSKNKYLIIPEQSYRRKIRSMQTVEMIPIHPKVPDSLLVKKEMDEFAGAERDSTVADSTAATQQEAEDSTYVITKDKEVRVLRFDTDSLKYRIENMMYTADQDNYMWYFRDVLVLPDVRAALDHEKNAKEGKMVNGKLVKKQKKGFLGFFKNLFKKKPNKDSIDAFNAPKVSGSSEDSVLVSPPKEKKGFFKKKKKSEAKVPEKKVDPAKKEDDGF